MSTGSPEEDPRTTITRAVVDRSAALPTLMHQHYSTLLGIAERIHSGERGSAGLSPTSMVHEVYLRLVDQPRVSASDTVFFRACFAQECRRVLVDHARRVGALRRGGDCRRESLGDQSEIGRPGEFDLIDLHEAIEQLTNLSPRMGRIADLRLFGGLTIEECAQALDVSPRLIDSEWAFARSWLERELR